MLTEESRTKLDGIIQQMVDNGETEDDIQFVVNDYKTKYDTPETQDNRGIVERRIDQSQSIMSNPNLSEVEKRIGYAGQGLGMVADIGGAVVKGAWDLAPDFITKPMEDIASAVGEASGLTPTLRTAKGKYNQWEQNNPRTANIVNAAGNAVGAGLTLASIKPTAKMIEGTVKATPKAYEYVKNAVTKEKNLDETVIKILRHDGSENITKQGKEALSVVDTEGVKTYKDLEQRIKKTTDDYKSKVDLELQKDPKSYKINEVPQKKVTVPEEVQNPDGTISVQQKTITENPLSTALDDLKNHYLKTRQLDNAKRVVELEKRAKDVGLTKKEINDIAREYKTDFLDKAYPKGGLNINNARIVKHEMTRRGLKDFARSGLTEGAKQIDETYSKLITTLKEVSSNVSKVAREKALTESGLLGVGGKAVNAVRHPLRTGANYILEEPAHINIVKSEKQLSKNLRNLKKQMATQNIQMTLPKSPYTLRNITGIQGIE